MKYRLVVLEGMSTSGKTTVMNLLVDKLKAKGIESKGFDDHKILANVFVHLNPKESLKELHKFLKEECMLENCVIVCDRFHLSHMAITKGSLEDLQEIETEMKSYSPLLVFLEIPEGEIKGRILGAKVHRDSEWEEELLRRGETEDEAIEFFKRTQHRLTNLYQQSSLPKITYNTESHNFEDIASQLVERIVQS